MMCQCLYFICNQENMKCLTLSLVSVKVNFSGGMPLKSTKEHFLSINVNKQKFIIMLGEKLEDAGCKTIHAREYTYTMMCVVL